MRENKAAAVLPLLEPEGLVLERGADARLRLRLRDGRAWEGVKAACSFPHTDRNHFIHLSDSEDQEIGLIEDLERLEPESRRVLAEALETHYFVPEILRIDTLASRFGVTTWKVVTDRGPREFEVRNREDIRRLPNGQMLIIDSDGNRFGIPHRRTLDARSRALLELQV